MNQTCPACQSPIQPGQQRCAACGQPASARNAKTAAPTDGSVSRPNQSSPQFNRESSDEIRIVPNYSRHAPRKVRIPTAVKSLDLKLKNLPAAGRKSNGNRFKTDSHTSQSSDARELFLSRYREAYELTESNKYGQALAVLTELIKGTSEHQQAECHGLRGYIFLQKMQLEKAVSECSKSIKLNPDVSQTWSWRAAARGEQNQWRRAFGDLEKAWDLSSDDRDRFTGLMDSYSDACEFWFKKQDKTADVLSEMGWVHFCRSRYGKAEDCFQQSLELESDHALSSAGMAKLIFHNKSSSGRYRSSRAAEVLQLCAVAIAGSSESHQIVLPIRIKIYRSKGDLDRAMDDLTHLSELAEEDAELVAPNDRRHVVFRRRKAVRHGLAKVSREGERSALRSLDNDSQRSSGVHVVWVVGVGCKVQENVRPR